MKPGLGWLKILVGVAVGFWAGLFATKLPSVKAAPDPGTPTELRLGAAMVRLGSAKSQVVTALSKSFVLKNMEQLAGGAESWLVRTKGEPSAVVGSLRFKNDVLVQASREWGYLEPDDKAVAFLKATYGAVEHVFGTGKIGTLHCTLLREPGTEHFQIHLFAYPPEHSVSIALEQTTSPGVAPYWTAFVEEYIDTPK